MTPVKAPAQAGPTRLRDKLMWRLDEDGEWQHRLADEWNGNDAGRVLWSRYDLATVDTRYTDLTCGITWSHWGLGPTFETSHEWPYMPSAGRSKPTRRTFVTLALGPFTLSLQILRPRRGFDG